VPKARAGLLGSGRGQSGRPRTARIMLLQAGGGVGGPVRLTVLREESRQVIQRLGVLLLFLGEQNVDAEVGEDGFFRAAAGLVAVSQPNAGLRERLCIVVGGFVEDAGEQVLGGAVIVPLSARFPAGGVIVC